MTPVTLALIMSPFLSSFETSSVYFWEILDTWMVAYVSPPRVLWEPSLATTSAVAMVFLMSATTA